jgi:hypothetical protein
MKKVPISHWSSQTPRISTRRSWYSPGRLAGVAGAEAVEAGDPVGLVLAWDLTEVADVGDRVGVLVPDLAPGRPGVVCVAIHGDRADLRVAVAVAEDDLDVVVAVDVGDDRRLEGGAAAVLHRQELGRAVEAREEADRDLVGVQDLGVAVLLEVEQDGAGGAAAVLDGRGPLHGAAPVHGDQAVLGADDELGDAVAVEVVDRRGPEVAAVDDRAPHDGAVGLHADDAGADRLDDLALAVAVEVGDRGQAVGAAVEPQGVAVEVVGGVAGDDLLDAVGVEVDDDGERAVLIRGGALALRAGADQGAGAREDRAADDDLDEAVAVHVGERGVVEAEPVEAGGGRVGAPLLGAVAAVERADLGRVGGDDLVPAVAVEVAEPEAAVVAVVAEGLPGDAAAVAPQRDGVEVLVEEHERLVLGVELARHVGVDRLTGHRRAEERAAAVLPLDDRVEPAHLQRDVAGLVERDVLLRDVVRGAAEAAAGVGGAGRVAGVGGAGRVAGVAGAGGRLAAVGEGAGAGAVRVLGGGRRGGRAGRGHRVGAAGALRVAGGLAAVGRRARAGG